MVADTEHDFVTAQRFHVVGGVPEELEVFAVVVADKVHSGNVVDETRDVDKSGFVILGEQRQTFVEFSQHQKMNGIVPAIAQV